MFLLKAIDSSTESILGIFDSLDKAQSQRDKYRDQFKYTVEPWDNYDIFELPLNQITEIRCRTSGYKDREEMLMHLTDRYTVNKTHVVELSTRHYTPTIKRDTHIPGKVSDWLHDQFMIEKDGYWYSAYHYDYKKVGKFFRILVVFANIHHATKFKLTWG